MTLTKEQESRLVAKYDPFIRKHVRSFFQRVKPWNAHCYDDLYQEARLAFLRLIRRLSCEEDLTLHGPCRLRGAMRDYCRQMALVAIPHNAYRAYVADFTRCPEDVMAMEDALPSVQAVDEELGMLLSEGLAALAEKERMALQLKMAGYSNREARSIVGAGSDAAMTRLLKRGCAHLAPYLFDVDWRDCHGHGASDPRVC